MTEVSKLKSIANAAIDNSYKHLYDLSMNIWMNPEIGYEEKYAHDILTTFLEEEGFEVEKHTPLETSFIARAGSDDGPQIAYLCEYDALPGIGHACGHNLIAEAGIAAGLGLKAAFSADSTLKGRVLVLGTPCEEGQGGKIEMLKRGSFDRCDVCMIVHPLISDVDLEDNHIISMEEFEIVFEGKAAHASAQPWEGINALDAAVACYTNVSLLRQQLPLTNRVHGIIKEGGKQPNIIPKRAALFYGIRAPTDADREVLKEKVLACAKGAAEGTGCTFEITTIGNAFSDMQSNINLRNQFLENLQVLGYDRKVWMGKPLLGSTDVGNVSKAVPSIHPYFGIPTTEDCHTETFARAAGSDAAQQPTIQMGKAMAMTGIDILCKPSFFEAIKKEFETTKLSNSK